jgi:hypothetical protein
MTGVCFVWNLDRGCRIRLPPPERYNIFRKMPQKLILSNINLRKDGVPTTKVVDSK